MDRTIADRERYHPASWAKEHGQRDDRDQQDNTMRERPSLPHLPSLHSFSIGAGDMDELAVAG
jgi:hypothetical protein